MRVHDCLLLRGFALKLRRLLLLAAPPSQYYKLFDSSAVAKISAGLRLRRPSGADAPVGARPPGRALRVPQRPYIEVQQ
jgi:hypothetical protein